MRVATMAGWPELRLQFPIGMRDDWKRAGFEVASTPRPTFPVHGVGHGFLFRHALEHAQTKFSPCGNPPISHDVRDLERAIADCWTLPESNLLGECFNGLWHSWVEYSDYSKLSPLLLFPCSTFQHAFNSMCFYWLFSSGQYWNHRGYVGRTTANQRMMSYAGNASQICLSSRMASEAVLWDCIYGLSSTHFLHFHEGWIAAKAFASPLHRCLQSPNVIGTFSEFSCRLLFKENHTIRTGATSLMDWCSAFVEPLSQQHVLRNMKRLMACVTGSTAQAYVPRKAGVSLQLLQSTCVGIRPGLLDQSVTRAFASFCRRSWEGRDTSRDVVAALVNARVINSSEEFY